MADVTIKQNDTRPFIDATLKDLNGPIDLSSSGGSVKSIKLLMFAVSSTTKIIEQTTTGVLLSRFDSTAGKVRYQWSSSDTATPGNYVAEFQINFFDNTVMSCPNDKHIGVVIEDGVEPG